MRLPSSFVLSLFFLTKTKQRVRYIVSVFPRNQIYKDSLNKKQKKDCYFLLNQLQPVENSLCRQEDIGNMIYQEIFFPKQTGKQEQKRKWDVTKLELPLVT